MNLEFDVVSGSPNGTRKESSLTRVVIIGNFSGTGAADSAPPSCNMFNLDPHDVDGAVSRIAPTVRSSAGDESIELTFASTEDFHPDTVFARYPAFAEIRRLKDALRNPDTEAEAALIARSLLGLADREPAAGTLAPAAQGATPGDASVEETFSRLLGRVAGGSNPVKDTLKRLLDDAVSQNAVAETSSQAASLSRQLDAWCQDAMRELLRLPEYREIESSWLSLRVLTERLETNEDEEVELWLADVGQSGPAVWSGQLPEAVNRALAGERPDLVVLLQDFSATDESLKDLRRAAAAATECGCPLLASADATLAGVPGDLSSLVALDKSHFDAETAAAWTAFRQEAAATRVGLGFPRLLYRQPYGSRSDPIDSFDFEELEAAPQHDDFSWCHSSIALAVFWLRDRAGVASSLLIDDLPLVTYDDGGGQAIMPATEIYISESATEVLLNKGLIPLTSHRGNTTVRIPRLQSAAATPTRL